MRVLKFGIQSFVFLIFLAIIAGFDYPSGQFFDGDPNEISAESYAFQTPIFKGKERNVLLRVAVHVPSKLTRQGIASLEMKLDETAQAAFDLLTVYLTGAENFSSQHKVGETRMDKGVFKIPLDIELQSGLHFFWVCGTLKANASTDKKIEIHASRIKKANGREIVIKETGGYFIKRIGVALRNSGDDSVHTYRIPGMAKTRNGTLISVFDIRYKNSGDLPGNIDVGMRRSKDGGNSWEPMKVIIDMGPPHENNGVGDPSILVDPFNGTIWVAALWSKGNRSIAGSLPGLSPDSTGQLVLVRSDDDGQTWSLPVSITPQVKDPAWHLFFNGPGAGITMMNGNLVFPAQYWDENKRPWSTLIYSRDHGKSWEGEIVGPKINTTESQVVELDSSVLMLNMRDNRGGFRSVATTNNMGKSWVEHPTSFLALPDPVCMASIIKGEILLKKKKQNVLFFSNPNSSTSRKFITIKASLDNGDSWLPGDALLIDENSSYGYSCLVQLDTNTVGLIYEGTGSLYFLSIPISEIISVR